MKELLTPEILLGVQSLGLLAVGLAFIPKIREWWLKVSGGKCQYEYYDDKFGWRECNRPANHIHHVVPDGWTRDRGGDPDDNVGMGLCDAHHVRNFNEEEHSPDFAFHTDIAHAYKSYREWKLQTEHMKEITGKKPTRNENPTPFDNVLRSHRIKSVKGERYWNGTEDIEDYYEQKMRDRAVKYIAQTGDKKPVKKSKTP